MRIATSALINSCETSKWLLYIDHHIFCWMPRKFTPMLFSSVSLYAFDFKFYIQRYILIKSIVVLSQLKLFHECSMLVAVVVSAAAVFAVVSKPLQNRNFSRINPFSTAWLKFYSGWSSSRLTGVEDGVKMLLVFDTSVWFALPPRIRGEAVLLNLWLCRKFAWPCWLKGTLMQIWKSPYMFMFI